MGQSASIYKIIKLKNVKLNIFFIFLVILSYGFFAFYHSSARTLNFNSEKIIILNDNGLIFEIKTEATTINALLQEKNISLTEHDVVIPAKETALYPGIMITIDRAIQFQLSIDDQLIENYSTAKTIGGILSENKIILGRLDKVSPTLSLQPHANEEIVVTRIDIEEKIITEDIAFKTTSKEDAKLGWHEKKVEQKGELGKIEIKYSITYKNGQEVSRVPLEKNIVSDPVTEIITQGTYMKLGKASTGQGTWYAFKGGMFAASTSLPRGSYARVTNLENGKSIVVQINDYGPQGKGRIIDLDKIAFASIASLGAGIIGVKVEAILN